MFLGLYCRNMILIQLDETFVLFYGSGNFIAVLTKPHSH
jgi:hypothetical protein